jgi:hypothetical protein|eukprot:COSAG06_NODE_2947_length_6044_cov_2.985029_1_plen_223_part_00
MTWRAGTILSAALLAAQCAPTPAFGQLPQLSVVNLTHPLDSDAMHVAVFGAAGLENRDEPKVYVLRDDDPTSDGALSPPAASRTAFWLQEIVSPKRQLVPTAALAFVQAAVAAHGAVLYDSTNEPWAFTTALTLAGVHSAVPLDVQLLQAVAPPSGSASLAIKFNTTGRWSTKEAAVRYAIDSGALASTGSLVINSIDDMLAGKLVDFIVQQKLFVLGKTST